MKRCSSCSRPMRPHGVSKADAPGTVATGTAGTCASCTGRAGGGPAEAQVDDAPCVLARTDLRPSTYQALARYAKENHTTVGAVLSILADRAVTPKTGRKPRARLGANFDDNVRTLNAEGLSDNRIAKRLGVAQSTVSRRRRDMHLESPTPRSGGRTKVTP